MLQKVFCYTRHATKIIKAKGFSTCNRSTVARRQVSTNITGATCLYNLFINYDIKNYLKAPMKHMFFAIRRIICKCFLNVLRHANWILLPLWTFASTCDAWHQMYFRETFVVNPTASRKYLLVFRPANCTCKASKRTTTTKKQNYGGLSSVAVNSS